MMAKSHLASKSLKEYLKRYESNTEEDKKRKKKKKRTITATKPNALSVLVVDEDPVWQKPINIEEENADNSTDEEKPQVDEDIEVKRLRRLEQLKAKRPYNSISEDGSGWVSLSPKHAKSSIANSDISPPRKTRARNDTPSPPNKLKPPVSGEEGDDFSPPRKRQSQYCASLELDEKPSSDSSPPRRQKVWKDTRLEGANPGHLDYVQEDTDLSPPRQRRKRHHTPSPELDAKPARSITPNSDISPPRQSDRYASKASLRGNNKTTGLSDLSPPRHETSVSLEDPHILHGSDFSPPRKQRKDVRRDESPELSAQHSQKHIVTDSSHGSLPSDLSPPRKKQKALPVPVSFKQKDKTGLLSRKEFGEDISKINKEDWMRFKERNPSVSSNAEPIYRDKIKGDRISKEEFLKSRGKVEEKPKEMKLEWGKGLAQKREAEAKLVELNLEKDRPFARTRDDTELDNMLRDRLRWGDPMAHLVKKRHSELVLSDLGDSEKMRESGFIIPQDIPVHSWLKRGLDAAPNRYGIRPGRHWDGVDRSNGFEKQLFKRMNEKQATEKEAYLWSVSDM